MIHSEETKKKISEAHKGKHHSEETKQKMSEAHKGEKHHLFGKHRSEKTKQKISEAHKGENNHLFGKHRSEETKQKISEINKGKYFSEETKKKISEALKGENNPNWKGGISCFPYCFRWTEKLREKIRERDGRICQNCDKTELENNQKLSVHHVHYDKENCYPDLITLCRFCNSIVNSNRDYWEDHFMKILEYRGFICLI